MGINAPTLAACPTSEECTFHVIVEQEPTCELNRFSSALIHLVATYFIYDIAHPKPFNSVVYDPALYFRFSDKQPDPSSVKELVTSLKRLDSTF